MFRSTLIKTIVNLLSDCSDFRSIEQIVQLIIESASLVIRVFVFILAAVYYFIFPKSLKPIAKKTVLITGAAQGIGKELARQYGSHGAKVICVDIDSARNQETVKELQQQGIEAYSYTCNVSDLQEVVHLAEKVKKDVGVVDILVNNAGIIVIKRLLDHTEQDVRSLFSVNILSQFWMLKTFLPDMVKKGGAHVVAMSSMSGLTGVEDMAGYASTKHAIRGLINSLRKECDRDGGNVKFTTAYPFYVATAMEAKINPKIRFPSLFPIGTPENVASEIITAQRLGCHEILLPKSFKTCLFLMERLPYSAQTAIWDYFF